MQNAFVSEIYDSSVISQIEGYMAIFFPNKRIYSVIVYYALCRFGNRRGLTLGEEVAEIVPSSPSRFLLFMESVLRQIFLPKNVALFTPRLIRMIPIGANKITQFPPYLLPLIIASWLVNRLRGEARKIETVENDEVNAELSYTGKCTICMSNMTVPSATVCGHVFCWDCIMAWTLEAKTCPTCRTECRPQDLLPLVHYCNEKWKPFWEEPRKLDR